MRIYVSDYTRMLEELKKKLEKERIKISKELFEKANGLNKNINKTILIVENKIVTLNTKNFDEKDEKFKKLFINYNGIYIANNLSKNEKNQLLDFNKETNKSERIDIKKIDIKDNPYEKIKGEATQAGNNTNSALQKLRQKLKELENEVSSLTSRLTSVDDTAARLITVKIAVLNIEISSIKAQIQMML